MIEPWHWIVLGLALIVVEAVTATFASFWFGVAALLMGGMTFLFPNAINTWQMQVLAWMGLSIIHMVIWFKVIQPVWKRRNAQEGLSSREIVGATGIIVEVPSYNQVGIIRFLFPKFGSTEWPCRSTDDNIMLGDKVIVTDIVGNELVVSSTQQVKANNKQNNKK